MEDKEQSIGTTSQLRLTKKDLIALIEKSFPNSGHHNTIAILTTVEVSNGNKHQSIVFGGTLK